VRRVVRWVAARAIGGFITVWVLSVLAVVAWSRRDDARPAAAIVVLGAAQWAGRPSPVLRARLDHAVDLWRAGLAPLLILTGGRGSRDTTTEAQVGRAYAIREGIPAASVLTEAQSRTTAESMRGVAALMNDHRVRDAILVSDPFHMLRLEILSRRLGLTTYSSPTRTSPISASREASWRHLLGESFKVLYTIVMGAHEVGLSPGQD
jgi:uncharacterized SAM-binding protein YcdF (DUF218 family)